MKLVKSESGFGLILTLATVAVIAFVGWVLISRITGGADPQETLDNADKFINSATNAVDKANQAKDKAGVIIDGE